MKMSGERLIEASRETVWEALNDPDVLKASIPGCQELNKTSDTAFEAVAQAKVGPVKAKFKGNVELSDIDPPNGYTISGQGNGGAAGFAKGGATVRLEEVSPGQTLLKYDVDANVGGKLAQIGQRLVDGAAKKMADEFFENFSAQVASPESAEPPVDQADAAETPARAAETEPDTGEEPVSRNVNPLVWIIVLGLAAALLLYLSSG